MLCKTLLTIAALFVAAPFSGAAATALAAPEQMVSATETNIFDADEFWAAYPADSGARAAWRQGVKWAAGRHSFAVYYDGSIFGFTSRSIPAEQDTAVQAKLAKAYAERVEMEAMQSAGLFAFDKFQCQALAGYPEIASALDLCNNMKIKSKMTSAWSNQAFSVIQIAASDICACRKALDEGQGEDNAGTFFAEIARSELNRLHSSGQSQAVLEFFGRHFKKKIFLAPELLKVAEAMAENKEFGEVLVLLDAVAGRFAPDLTSEQWERCGDLYYQAGQENKAVQAYLKASEALYR